MLGRRGDAERNDVSMESIKLFEEEEANFISLTCYISSAYILKYIMQLVIEGKIKRQNMSVYDIPL